MKTGERKSLAMSVYISSFYGDIPKAQVLFNLFKFCGNGTQDEDS